MVLGPSTCSPGAFVTFETRQRALRRAEGGCHFGEAGRNGGAEGRGDVLSGKSAEWLSLGYSGGAHFPAEGI